MEPSSLASWVVAAGAPPADAQEAGQALLLWVILAGGLGIFLIGVLLVTLSRRNRTRAKPPTPSGDLDAWQTSAERLAPPPAEHR